MTSISHASFFRVNKEEAPKKSNNMNVIAFMLLLLIFLASIFVHSNHLIAQATNVEASECYICHQGVDTPPELPQIKFISTVSYFLNTYQVLTIEFKDNHFIQPQLRAPPAFQ